MIQAVARNRLRLLKTMMIFRYPTKSVAFYFLIHIDAVKISNALVSNSADVTRPLHSKPLTQKVGAE
jgi:hypothetical protein